LIKCSKALKKGRAKALPFFNAFEKVWFCG